MFKTLITLNDEGVVTSQKYVGMDCAETDNDILIDDFEVDIIDTEYFDKTGEFKDIDGKVKHKEPKKPKMKKAKKAKKPKG